MQILYLFRFVLLFGKFFGLLACINLLFYNCYLSLVDFINLKKQIKKYHRQQGVYFRLLLFFLFTPLFWLMFKLQIVAESLAEDTAQGDLLSIFFISSAINFGISANKTFSIFNCISARLSELLK